MTRKPEREDRDADVLSRTAPVAAARPSVDDSRPPVDETQSTRQSATAPQPKLGPDDADDDITGEELDEAWARLTLALKTAYEDFDSAGAYESLTRSLPADLVQMPLVERASLPTTGSSRREFRNLALGLVAMGTVCAGLGALAAFGPGFERKPRDEQGVAARTTDAPPRTIDPSSGAGEVWHDVRWEENLLALAHEFEAERHRLREVDQNPSERLDDELARLERDFDRMRHEFGDRANF